MEFFRSFDEFCFGLQCFETIQFNTRQVIAELFQNSIDAAQHFNVCSTLTEILEYCNSRIDIERVHANNAGKQRLDEMIR